jgi:hypothetical protein
VLPLMVVIGWIAGLQMDLLFGTYQSVCLILAVMIANATMVDGKSNWLEGSVPNAAHSHSRTRTRRPVAGVRLRGDGSGLFLLVAAAQQRTRGIKQITYLHARACKRVGSLRELFGQIV